MSKNKKRPKSTKKKSVVRIRKSLVVTVCALVIAVVAVVLSVILIIQCNAKENQLKNTVWMPSKVYNASSDEVELAQVYNTNYSSYQGSLSFDENGNFSLWMSPGEASDGTRTGKYSVENNIVKAVFDNGTEAEFKLNLKDNAVESILVYYDEYEVVFQKQ